MFEQAENEKHEKAAYINVIYNVKYLFLLLNIYRTMSTTSRYNEFPAFLKRYFPYKVQKISLNAVVPIAITRLLIRTTAAQRNRYVCNWRKENVSSPINIRK